MGLDILDIQFRVEKAFGVELTHDDLFEVMRDRDILVGDLYSLLLKKLLLHDVARYDVRLNYRLWEQMQRVVQSASGAPLEQIELKTPLAVLFPRDTRRTAWETLRRECPYRLAQLDYPKAVRWAGFGLAVGMVLVEQLRIGWAAGANWLWPVLGLIGIWMVSETYLKVLWMCRPLRNSFPARMATVKDLCRTVLATNYEEICGSSEIPFDDRCLEVWRQLTGILVDALGVEADAITFRSRLFQDLGAG